MAARITLVVVALLVWAAIPARLHEGRRLDAASNAVFGGFAVYVAVRSKGAA